jgi:hypothetical protein
MAFFYLYDIKTNKRSEGQKGHASLEAACKELHAAPKGQQLKVVEEDAENNRTGNEYMLNDCRKFLRDKRLKEL